MKSSRYNYYVPNGNNIIFFNGITEGFFVVPKDKALIYQEIIENPDAYLESCSSFLDKIKMHGFILNDDIDEMDLFMDKFRFARKPDEYYLMILPTYQCNLRCWYCVQEHADKWLSNEMVCRIKKRIRLRLSDDKIKKFHLSWFGGEPLLAYNTIVDITTFAKKEAESRSKSFYGSITTNGTLLNKERIEQLQDLGISSYQITIDGDKETHDKVKVLGKGSAFDIVINNVSMLAEGSQCILRFNYTQENLKPKTIINDLKNRFSDKAKHNIQLHIFKVWQESEDNIKDSDVTELFELSREAGLNPMFQRPQMCYADQEHFECVFTDGKVGKCDNEPDDLITGTIGSDGDLKDFTRDQYSFDINSKVMKQCRDCKFLPLCMGPCPAKREKMLREHGVVRCMYPNPDKEMANYIRNICRIQNPTII